jgi:hypothetical protein
MIDNFALLVSHGLMMLAAWRLLSRADLDDAAAPVPVPAAAAKRRPPREDAPGA